MIEKLKALRIKAEELMNSAASTEAAEALRVAFLGKKGELTEILKSMKDLPPEGRRALGLVANETKAAIEDIISRGISALKEKEKQARFDAEAVDVTEPGVQPEPGHPHLMGLTIDSISQIFMNMGFSISEGPEIETVFNNFDALNAGPNHPSRDMSDTFYITEDTLLRTQTSPVQVRTIMSRKPPFRVISPGRVFRCDTPDATHSPMFHQLEGLLVDEGISMSDLKGVLSSFARQMFGPETQTKFRPHHFPFTEPSAEMDVSCFKCGGKGCSLCKGSGWIEILGCGMVHPNVLAVGGIDSEKYTGFAFGMGLERIAMIRHGVDDIRLLYENDLRFIKQFK